MVEDEVVTASLLDGVNAIAVDGRALEILLREPRSHFLYLLAHPPLFAWPRHVYEREGRDWHRTVPLVGNGPYVLISRDEHRDVIAAARAGPGRAATSAR
jgi:ABC-type oligopeptide transport system substrate-binding subunit